MYIVLTFSHHQVFVFEDRAKLLCKHHCYWLSKSFLSSSFFVLLHGKSFRYILPSGGAPSRRVCYRFVFLFLSDC